METKAYKRPESVLVVVYAGSGEVLLMERAHPAGFWQSVTGSLEWGEDPRTAALREVLEETGLDVAAALVDCAVQNRFTILPAWRARYAPDVDTNLEHVFTARLDAPVGVTLDPQEHRRARWLPRDEALELASSETNRAAIKALPIFD